MAKLFKSVSYDNLAKVIFTIAMAIIYIYIYTVHVKSGPQTVAKLVKTIPITMVCDTYD